MSGRNSKNRARLNQRLSRDNRADSIERFGTAVFPCSSCVHFGEVACFLRSGVPSCNHCTRHQRLSCDVVKMNSLDRVDQERERLEKEQRDTEDEVLELQQKFQEELSRRIGKIKRLRLQQDLLKKRATEMLKEGLRLDELEAREREEEQQRVEAEQVQLASEIDAVVEQSTNFDWSSLGVDLGVGPLSPGSLAALATVGQDSGGGNPQPDPSHSSNG